MNQQQKQLEERCREHWQRLEIKDVDTLKDHIKAIFEEYDHQSDALIDLYRMILPDWDRIEKIKESPEAEHDLWKFICKQFIEFDSKHHPKVFRGGAWLNSGFSSNGKVDPWEINFENCRVIMK
jgi:hypothetical protein